MVRTVACAAGSQFIWTHPVVCPVMFTTNQNINTVLYPYDTSPIQLELLRLIHVGNKSVQKQLNGLHVSPCCPVFCPIVAHSIVNTMGQTTGCSPIAAQRCPYCPVVCPVVF